MGSEDLRPADRTTPHTITVHQVTADRDTALCRAAANVTDALQLTLVDTFGLTLFGEASVLGRSIVIHKADKTKLACASIAGVEAAPRVATAHFGGNGGITGTITLTQAAAEGPTVIETALRDFKSEDAPFPWRAAFASTPHIDASHFAFCITSTSCLNAVL